MTAPIDVVVVSYNRQDLLTRCLASLQASERATRVVVVDNASSDDSVAVVSELYPKATMLLNDTNVGFAAAVNRGVACGSAPLVLLLNSDATVDTATLDVLKAALDRDSSLAAVGPRILGEDGELELSTGRTMSLWNEAWFKIAGVMGGARGWLFGPRLRRQYAIDRDTASLTAACLLLRREAYEQIAGLDERFFLYAEDVDLCRRLGQAGWRLRYVAGATARHLRGGSGTSNPAPAALAYRASQVAFYAKHRGRLSRVILRLYLEARYGLGRLRGDDSDRAIWDWLRSGRLPLVAASR